MTTLLKPFAEFTEKVHRTRQTGDTKDLRTLCGLPCFAWQLVTHVGGYPHLGECKRCEQIDAKMGAT